jgi:5-methylcytosine-specific restriction endonuclease McrA
VTTLRRPQKDCAWTLCGATAERGRYCLTHYRQRLAQLHQSQSPSERKQKYGKGWNTIRSAIIERDGKACVACGAASPLEVHHMHETSRRPEHLVTLCKKCHSAANSRRVVEAVTGWMRLLYGGGQA